MRRISRPPASRRRSARPSALLTRPDEPDDRSFLSHVRLVALAPGPAGDIARVVKRADMEDRLRHPRDPGGAWIPPYSRALEILAQGPPSTPGDAALASGSDDSKGVPR